MAERKLDPDALAERLDSVLPPAQDDAPAEDADPLVDAAVWLAGIPQPRPVMPDVKARLRSQFLDAYDHPMPGAPGPSPTLSVTGWFVVGMVVVILVIAGVTLTRVSPGAVAPSPEATEEPTLTATATAAPVTPTPVEATPEVSLPTTIVIEGPVEAINANIITVYDMNIQVDPADPILAEAQLDDTIRVEGNLVEDADTLIIIAVNIIIVETHVITDLPPGSPLPAHCKITKKGKVKCTRKIAK